MNPLFLLNLISDLLKSDKPTVEEIRCARVILENLVKEYDIKEPLGNMLSEKSDLSPEAEKAKRELI